MQCDRPCAARRDSRASERCWTDFVATPSPARAGSRRWVSGFADASSRCCTTAVARSSRSRNRCGGMSGRRPTFSASAPSSSARSTSAEKPSSDSWAAGCRRRCARRRDRRAGPARRSPASAMPLRPEMASRCAWLLVLAISTRSVRQAAAIAASTGPATAMSSSWASCRINAVGALLIGASGRTSRRAPWLSISSIRRRRRRRTGGRGLR